MRADHEAVAAQLPRAVEPDVATEVNRCPGAEPDAEHAAIPGVTQAEARDVADDVVRQVVQRPDHEQLDPPGLLSGLEPGRLESAARPNVVHGDAHSKSPPSTHSTLARPFGFYTARSGRPRPVEAARCLGEP